MWVLADDASDDVYVLYCKVDGAFLMPSSTTSSRSNPLPLGLITPRNELNPRSYWTPWFSTVKFALKAAALSPCRRCICHVGPRFISSVTSSRFFGRNASVQPPLFLRCFSSYLWLRWHRVHRSTPALTQSKAFSPALSRRLQVWSIVIGGYGFAHGEPGAKKALAGVAAGTGIAVLAVNVLSWLWGV